MPPRWTLLEGGTPAACSWQLVVESRYFSLRLPPNAHALLGHDRERQVLPSAVKLGSVLPLRLGNNLVPSNAFQAGTGTNSHVRHTFLADSSGHIVSDGLS